MAIDVEAFYRQYGPMVLRRCRTLLKDEDLALDALQEVFVNLLRNQERLHASYPSSLLFRMATNTCLNMIRDRKRKAEIGDEAILLDIAAYDESEKKLWLEDILGVLFSREKSSTREIMTLLVVDEMTLEEVSRTVGLSVSGVRKRVREFKARAQSQAVKEIGYEE